MFGFKSKAQKSAELTPEFRTARSMNTSVIHIETGVHDILCGSTTAMYGRNDIPASASIILESLGRQHEGWRWCVDCAVQLTGQPKSIFVEALNRIR